MDNSQPKKQFPLGRIARLTFRTLALATLAACLVAWVVSYRTGLRVFLRGIDGYLLTSHSFHGSFSLQYSCYDYPAIHGWWPMEMYERDDPINEKPFVFSTDDGTHWEKLYVVAPYWFLTTLAAMATALSFKRTWRFTTRQLLIATTAVAAILAAAVWSMRD